MRVDVRITPKGMHYELRNLSAEQVKLIHKGLFMKYSVLYDAPLKLQEDCANMIITIDNMLPDMAA